MNDSQLPSNQELAKQYFAVAAQNSASWDTYLSIRDIISKADRSISEHFDCHGNLKELNVCGVGKKTILILETILGDSLQAARDKIARSKEVAIQQEFFGYVSTTDILNPDEDDRGGEKGSQRDSGFS